MNPKFLPRFLLLLLIPLLLFSACISNKKHKEAIALLQSQSEAKLNEEIKVRDSKLNIANNKITNLNLQLAERKGENNILLLLRNELQDTIVKLETDIENLSNQTSSTQQNLTATLRAKDKEIADLKSKIKAVNNTLNRYEEQLNKLKNDLSVAIQYVNHEKYSIEIDKGELVLALVDNLLFKSNSVTRLEKSAALVLEKVSGVLSGYPNMFITVTGHTDNSPPRRKADVDNWNISAQRAATIVRVLSDDFEIGPHRLLLAAKGEFAPRASNETAEGKQQNRRIELVIAPSDTELIRAVQKVLIDK